MSLFKKNITISQFTADAINNSYDFYDSNIDKMLEMENADEFKVMNSKDKAELKEFGYSLITADLLLSIMLHFSDKISSEEAGELITSLNIKYLKEVKQLEISEIEKKTNKLIELLDHLEKKRG